MRDLERTNDAPSGRGEPLVWVRDLTCRLGGRDVLRGMTFDLSDRRIGIVGRNGSGKSTLARVLAGLIPADVGTVRIAGVDVARDRRGALATVGILFQNPDHQIIFPTVEEEVAFGLSQQGLTRSDAREEARRWLARWDRADWAPRPVATLSQGQRHLVCLISVLAMQPKVILLDEPFSGLDIPTTRALRAQLDALEPSLIHITHDPAAIAGYDRILWIEEGRRAADGPPDEVLPRFLAAMEEPGQC